MLRELNFLMGAGIGLCAYGLLRLLRERDRALPPPGGPTPIPVRYEPVDWQRGTVLEPARCLACAAQVEWERPLGERNYLHTCPHCGEYALAREPEALRRGNRW